MGAEFRMDEIPEGMPLRAAWLASVDKAQYMHGHGGYTGTIAESPGFRDTGKVFATLAEASDWADAHARKWEESLVVTVTNESGTNRYFAGVYSS